MAGKQIDSAFVDNPAHLMKLGRALVAAGEGEKAVTLVNQALALAPGDPLVQQVASVILTHQVPQFHGGMLADEARNDTYAKAIAAALSGGETVLDVGTGSGLLAMMAAQAGAAEVVACEANTTLAATAREIVAANGFPGIRVIGKHSTKLDPGEVGGPVDVIIHEIFGHDVVGEGVLDALADAVSRFTRPGSKIIPAEASVRVALAEFKEVKAPPTDCGVGGQYDLRLFSRHVPTFLKLEVGSRHLQLRSEPHDLFDYDFSDPSSFQEKRVSLAATSTGGLVNGIVQWLRIRFDEGLKYENQPAPGTSSHWKAIFHPFDAVLTDEGDSFTINGWQDGSTLRIWGSPGQEA